MTLVHVAYPAPFLAVPRRGAVPVRGHARAVVPVELRDVPASEFGHIAEAGPHQVSYHGRGGSLWIRARLGHAWARPDDLVARLEGVEADYESRDDLRSALSRTAVRALHHLDGKLIDTNGTEGALDGMREVLQDGTAGAADAVRRFLDEDVLVAGDRVMVRSRGPMATFHGTMAAMMPFPNREWVLGPACRADRAGELKAFLLSSGRPMDPSLPATAPGYDAIPAELLPDDTVMAAQVLPGIAFGYAARFRRKSRGEDGGDGLDPLLARMAPTVQAAMTGQVEPADAERAVRDSAELLLAAQRVHALALGAGRRWAEAQSGREPFELAVFARDLLAPRMGEGGPVSPLDEESLSGLRMGMP